MVKQPALVLIVGPHCFECLDGKVEIFFTPDGENFYVTEQWKFGTQATIEEINFRIKRAFYTIKDVCTDQEFVKWAEHLGRSHDVGWWWENKGKWIGKHAGQG